MLRKWMNSECQILEHCWHISNYQCDHQFYASTDLFPYDFLLFLHGIIVSSIELKMINLNLIRKIHNQYSILLSSYCFGNKSLQNKTDIIYIPWRLHNQPNFISHLVAFSQKWINISVDILVLLLLNILRPLSLIDHYVNEYCKRCPEHLFSIIIEPDNCNHTANKMTKKCTYFIRKKRIVSRLITLANTNIFTNGIE